MSHKVKVYQFPTKDGKELRVAIWDCDHVRDQYGEGYPPSYVVDNDQVIWPDDAECTGYDDEYPPSEDPCWDEIAKPFGRRIIVQQDYDELFEWGKRYKIKKKLLYNALCWLSIKGYARYTTTYPGTKGRANWVLTDEGKDWLINGNHG